MKDRVHLLSSNYFENGISTPFVLIEETPFYPCLYVRSHHQRLIIVTSCGLASEFVANLGLSGGSGISGVQVAMAVVTLVFKILEIISVLWESEVQASRINDIDGTV